jgi:hypothetical protein
MSDDSGDEIRRKMAAARNQLRTDVQSLVRSARVKTDWRHYVEQYPWLCLSAAALVGFWLVPKAARKMVLDPEILARLKSGQVPAVPQVGKSVLGLVTGTVVPLLTRMAVTKLMSHFLETEPPAEPTAGSAQPSGFSRYPKPK